MSNISFDRQKYIGLMNSHGLHVALTQLHHDLREWELETFEGRDGWKPAQWKELEDIRTFSRELWDIGLNNPEVNTKQDALFVD